MIFDQRNAPLGTQDLNDEEMELIMQSKRSHYQSMAPEEREEKINQRVQRLENWQAQRQASK